MYFVIATAVRVQGKTTVSCFVIRYNCTFTTVYVRTPLMRFSILDISTVGIVSTPKRSALETSRRELSEDVSFGIGTLLVVEQSTLEH